MFIRALKTNPVLSLIQNLILAARQKGDFPFLKRHLQFIRVKINGLGICLGLISIAPYGAWAVCYLRTLIDT